MTSSDTTAATALHADLGWALGAVFRAYVRGADAVMEGLPGGARGYQILAFAVQDDASGNQGTIARELGIDRTVLTYLIDDLERLGLVVRRPGVTDRRNRRVVATDAGRELWSQLQAALCHIEERILAGLGDDAPAFRDMLHRAAATAGETSVGEVCEAVRDLTLKLTQPGDRQGSAPAPGGSLG
ncbi:MarR family transcriptional regulator [Streptosporangiaceae bacterium NEAU-GS5]|nr:MarR family transcriptional regulator [Streptosporangiaceae bacterium NEAU-GS5]